MEAGHSLHYARGTYCEVDDVNPASLYGKPAGNAENAPNHVSPAGSVNFCVAACGAVGVAPGPGNSFYFTAGVGAGADVGFGVKGALTTAPLVRAPRPHIVAPQVRDSLGPRWATPW